jgi:dipeptidyl aminopeptidase/acylaminoacyl peptidase
MMRPSQIPPALSLLVFLAAPALPAQQSSQAGAGWTPELHMAFRTVQGTALSPDGSRVAFVVREPLMEGEQSEYRSHVWVADADGSRTVQYTRGEHSAGSPTFSPDGRKLAFTTARSGESQVWVMPVDGGEAWQLTEAEAGVGAFRWSPDGAWIAFTMRDPETEDEKERRRERRDVTVVDRDFKYAHLYLVPLEPDAEGKRPARRITEGAFHVTSFDWTPDGRHLVFAHQADPRINTARLSGDISVVPAEGGATRLLVGGEGVHESPLVSPDGRRVAFVSTGERPEQVGLGDVYVVPFEGGTPRKLAETHDRSPSLRAWSADGGELYLDEWVRTGRHVLALPADGAPWRQLTPTGGVHSNVSFSADGRRLAFTHEAPETPPDVHVSEVDRFAARKVSDLHAHVEAPPMARTEVLTWRASDGLEVEGLLTYPAEVRPGRRYPLILQVHGGPAGIYAETFTGGPSLYMTQFFAEYGYAVLRPNPRGSAGYGREFRHANVQDWGFGDLDDLLTGVDHVIEMGLAHPDSLALMGWSYGGYMTSFAVTRTDRFRAASMGAGLSNLVSMVTTTDIPDYLVAHMGGSEIWEDYATYERHSAIYGVANVTTPTQVIHGERDLRVPFTQGQEFYVALQRKGVATEFVVLPRTAHGPQEPKLLMEVSLRILDWFERHLRPGAAAAATLP